MVAPNLVNLSTIIGKTAVQKVTTSYTPILQNADSSGVTLKVNGLWVSNVDGINNASVSVDFYRDSASYHFTNDVVVPVNATLEIFNKSVYLEEGDTIRISGSDSSDLEAICSYEEIS